MSSVGRQFAQAVALATLVAIAVTWSPPPESSVSAASRLTASTAAGELPSLPATAPSPHPRAISRYRKLALSFEANRGQTDHRVRFLSHGPGYALFLTPSEAVLKLRRAVERPRAAASASLGAASGAVKKIPTKPPDEYANAIARIRLVGANPDPHLEGIEPLPGKVNYIVGNDPRKWRSDIPTYARVAYRDVYPGIDQLYYGGSQRQLEYDFVVAPGANPEAIRLRFEGADSIRFNREGDLVVAIGGEELIQRAPVIYQERAGRRERVGGRCLMRGRYTIGFELAAYDRSRPLYIDPGLVYSTFLGGSADDGGFGIAVDALGSAYVTGSTSSANFPVTAGAFQDRFHGGGFDADFDAFVAKLTPDGSGLVYSTYLGGRSGDAGAGIAVDASGSAYVTGFTASSDFPTTIGAHQTTFGGCGTASPFCDAFVTKLTPDGSRLAYSTYLGGAGDDQGAGIAVDASGNAYVTGHTDSRNFPAKGFQTEFGGGGSDAFVAKIKANGSSLVYSTFLGGSDSDEGLGIAVDASGSAYVTGATSSSDFPVTPDAFQTSLGGREDTFVTKIKADGSGLAYSTFLGGIDNDEGLGIAVDGSGSAFVTGDTVSTDFPATAGAFQTSLRSSNGEAFVTKLKADGSALAYSTFLGGTEQDRGTGIAVDALGSAYVTGATLSTDFPTTPDASQTTLAGGQDAFVTKLTADGSGLVYSTYLGGTDLDTGDGIATDGCGDGFVTGLASTNFPTTAGAFQTTAGGGVDAFVTELATPAVVATENGSVEGTPTVNTLAFLGIPYAAPPIGSLRWMPPQPPAQFQDVFQANSYGNSCTQPDGTGSEDCLTLNVFMPMCRNDTRPLPVMVWIHGGGLVSGGSDLYFPGPLVAKNVIVVTINYRLGYLGFFAHPAIDGEGHRAGNYGLMDQQFALQWVQRNIAAFGGDPNRVTIFGESAGGQSVYSNLASPTAAGLFQRAISESGAYVEFQSYFDFIVPLAQAETAGTTLVPSGTSVATMLGCNESTPQQTAQCLRAVPASALIAAEPGTIYPFVDGTILAQTPTEAFASGQFNQVPVISGGNHDEYRIFVADQYDLMGNPLITLAQYQAAVRALWGPTVAPLVDSRYPLSSYPSPGPALSASGTDGIFACPERNSVRLLSQHVKTYAYEFNDENAPDLGLPPVSFPLGAFHFAEVQYLFDFGALFTPGQQQLSDTMIGYWTQFATTGDPNFRGAPVWSPYISRLDHFQSLIPPEPKVESTFDSDHKCSSFWSLNAPTPVPTRTPSPTRSPRPSATPRNTPTPTVKPTPRPTPTPAAKRSPTPTPRPIRTPTPR